MAYNGDLVCINSMFQNLGINETKSLGKRNVCGNDLYIVAKRLLDNELVIVVTDACPDSALDDYLKRWKIGPMFSNLKESGFRFEENLNV